MRETDDFDTAAAADDRSTATVSAMDASARSTCTILLRLGRLTRDRLVRG